MKSIRLVLLLVLGLGIQGKPVDPSPLQAQIYDFSTIEIDVRSHADGGVQFHFFSSRKDPTTQEKIPARMYRLTVFEPTTKRILWRIETSHVPDMTTSVSYGPVPEGFKQIVPATGSAPTLEPGQRYSVSAYCDADGIGMTSFTAK